MISSQFSGWAALVRQPDWAGLGWPDEGEAGGVGWARLGEAGEAAGLGKARRRRLGWAGLAELSEQWQVMVKCRIQAPTSITDSMDQCSKVDM